jgi:hypothetical protein
MHFALRQLMHEASDQAGCDPDQLSFIHTVRVVRRHLPFHAAFPPRQRRRMVDLILLEIVSVPAERSRGRHNPRAVKRKMSNFPTKSRAAPSSTQRIHYDDHIRLLVPAHPSPSQKAGHSQRRLGRSAACSTAQKATLKCKQAA